MTKENRALLLDSVGSALHSLPAAGEHPHAAIFGPFSERVVVGANFQATVVAANPRLAGADFGTFKIPSLRNLLEQDSVVLRGVRSNWTLSTRYEDQARSALVPPETGRALLLNGTRHHSLRDVLVKGSGLVKRFTVQNKLRFSARGFNGLLELSEAERDLVNSEILHLAGVLVAAPLGVVDHHYLQHEPNFTAWTGNYIRGFRCQTRISNLFELDTPTRKAAIDDAIARLTVDLGVSHTLSYPEYFQRVLEISAKNAAIMQAAGFTQEGLHYGQISLCGEIADFGIGNFRKPTRVGELNSLYPWFRYERQPILMQNIFYKTHAVKAEPEPIELDQNSRSVAEQQTLFGAIRSFSPESAEAIERMEPARIFWNIYEYTFRRFDHRRFRSEVLDKIDDYFNWTPEKILDSIPRDQRKLAMARYKDSLGKLNEHFENQILTWDRRGPMSIHKQILFASAVRSVAGEMKLDFSNEPNGVWDLQSGGPYFCEDEAIVNSQEDLSWKPSSARY